MTQTTSRFLDEESYVDTVETFRGRQYGEPTPEWAGEALKLTEAVHLYYMDGEVWLVLEAEPPDEPPASDFFSTPQDEEQWSGIIHEHGPSGSRGERKQTCGFATLRLGALDSGLTGKLLNLTASEVGQIQPVIHQWTPLSVGLIFASIAVAFAAFCVQCGGRLLRLGRRPRKPAMEVPVAEEGISVSANAVSETAGATGVARALGAGKLSRVRSSRAPTDGFEQARDLFARINALNFATVPETTGNALTNHGARLLKLLDAFDETGDEKACYRLEGYVREHRIEIQGLLRGLPVPKSSVGRADPAPVDGDAEAPAAFDHETAVSDFANTIAPVLPDPPTRDQPDAHLVATVLYFGFILRGKVNRNYHQLETYRSLVAGKRRPDGAVYDGIEVEAAIRWLLRHEVLANYQKVGGLTPYLDLDETRFPEDNWRRQLVREAKRIHQLLPRPTARL
ncbi:MAG: hypothetical protein HY897_15450 [Deltaproteobacteria bacterium]|nr:hypothetical protein [Deltaproteobacteria bacterium]